MRNFEIPASLRKFANANTNGWKVGGVASSFHRDLDGEAITPDAIAAAIPGFMAARGADGIIGGPMRLHHDFWTGFLRDAIASLRLPIADQMELISAISLPIGRVTKIWVDGAGKTHWEGFLSPANPVARVIWGLLREGAIHLGVSLGGKIYETRSGGRDRLNRPCTLITKIRIDELSVTDNPALRLTEGEDTGAYIQALAKSVQKTYRNTMKQQSTLRPKQVASRSSSKVERFLRKAIAHEGDNVIGLNINHDLGAPKSQLPKGKAAIQMDAAPLTTGIAGKAEKANKKNGTGQEPPTDVWGMTIEQFTRALGKCAQNGDRYDMEKGAMLGSEEMVKSIYDGALGITHAIPDPTPEVINFVAFLRKLANFAEGLMGADDWTQANVGVAMQNDLYKALEDFQENYLKTSRLYRCDLRVLTSL